MAEHFNELTPAEAERLAILIEECGEVIQNACKILRHGFESHDPTVIRGVDPSNREMLAKEMGDLSAAMDMVAEHDVNPGLIVFHANNKRENVKKWMHHREPSHDR